MDIFEKLFKKDSEKKLKKGKNMELDIIIESLEANLSNNYKDSAQQDLKRLIPRFEELKADHLLKDEQIAFYQEKIDALAEKLKNFSHADQKPYWTKD